MTIIVWLVILLELLGATAMGLVWGWHVPIIIAVAFALLYKRLSLALRNIWLFLNLLASFFAVMETGNPYGWLYGLLSVVGYIGFLIALSREMR